MSRRLIILLAATMGLAGAAYAHDVQVGNIRITQPWSRPTPPGVPMGVAYFTLENRGTAEDVLLSASTPVAARVEFHQTTMSEGVARMRSLTQLLVPAGRTVKAEPGGVHLMLVELKQPLEAGDRVPLTLIFRDAGEVQVMLGVADREAAPPGKL